MGLNHRSVWHLVVKATTTTPTLNPIKDVVDGDEAVHNQRQKYRSARMCTPLQDRWMVERYIHRANDVALKIYGNVNLKA